MRAMSRPPIIQTQLLPKDAVALEVLARTEERSRSRMAAILIAEALEARRKKAERNARVP